MTASAKAITWALANPRKALEELERIERENKIDSVFPDTGPFRRELYPKHMQFIAAGVEVDKTDRQRGLIAANRCITPDTPIEMGRSTRRIVELLGEKSFDVTAWDGDYRCTKRASGVFLKCIEPAFRLLLGNGQELEVTRKHRVLTREGWLSLDQLILRSNGLHCWQNNQGSTDNYVEDVHRNDVQLRVLSDIGSKPFPLKGGVRKHHTSLFSREGALEHKSKYTHVYQDGDLPSIHYNPQQIADLCDKFARRDVLHIFERYSYLFQELRRYVSEYGRILSFQGSVHSYQYAGDTYLDHSSIECPASQDKLEPPSELIREYGLSLEWFDIHQSKQVFVEGIAQQAIFLPFDTPALIGGQSIIGIVKLGLRPILDFTVDDVNCYESGGVINHNTGKTFLAAYETTCHLTGLYPKWWHGIRFDKPISAWAAGDTSQTTRDIVQKELLGELYELGTGMIPKRCIVDTTAGRGISDSIDTVQVRHVSGGVSMLGFRSYDQGRKKFQGTAKHWIWLDEESDEGVYEECLMRTMTTRGHVICTFTPLLGLSKVVLRFLPHMAPPSDEEMNEVPEMQR